MSLSSETENHVEAHLQQIANAIGQACFTAAMNAYEEAGFDGLCQNGRWQCAREAITAVDIKAIVAQMTTE